MEHVYVAKRICNIFDIDYSKTFHLTEYDGVCINSSGTLRFFKKEVSSNQNKYAPKVRKDRALLFNPEIRSLLSTKSPIDLSPQSLTGLYSIVKLKFAANKDAGEVYLKANNFNSPSIPLSVIRKMSDGYFYVFYRKDFIPRNEVKLKKPLQAKPLKAESKDILPKWFRR